MTTTSSSNVAVGQMQNRKPRKKIAGHFTAQQFVFLQGNRHFRAARMAEISAADLDPRRYIPGFPVFYFRPEAGVPYVVDGIIYGVPDEHVVDKFHYFAILWPSPGCNTLTEGVEVLTDRQFKAVLTFTAENGRRPSSRHPETGQRVTPAWQWKDIAGQQVQDGETRECILKPMADNRLVAFPLVADLSEEEVASKALVLADELDIIADPRKQMVRNERGQMIHFAKVLRLQQPLLDITNDDVRHAIRKVARPVHPDVLARRPAAVQEAMAKVAVVLTSAKAMAEAYINARDRAKEEGKLDELLKSKAVQVSASATQAPPAPETPVAAENATPAGAQSAAEQESPTEATDLGQVDTEAALELLS